MPDPIQDKQPVIKTLDQQKAEYSSGNNDSPLRTNESWRSIVDLVNRSSAAGPYNSQIQTFMHGVDRFQRNILPTNSEHSGLTFITRPRLNLQSSSLRADRCFAPLDGAKPDALAFAIRAYLDTALGKKTVDKDLKNAILDCPYIDSRSPFFTPLSNALTGISGWPDPVMQTVTTDPGFHSEDQTTALGHDDLSKTYDLNLSFKDIQHGPIASIFFYWLRNMHNLMKGRQIAYADDIDNQRLNYTVSIYRFNLDPSRRFITKYAKATGCFPKSVPLGAMFNFGEGELFVSSAGKFNIPFVANKVEYNDYGILLDFNRLAERYWPTIDGKEGQDYINLKGVGINNFRGRPYVDTKSGRLEMLFRTTPAEQDLFVTKPNQTY